MAKKLTVHQRRTLREMANDGRAALWHIKPSCRRAMERMNLIEQIPCGHYWDFTITAAGRQALETGVVPTPTPSAQRRTT